jgi:hypothetical protein
LTLTAKPLAGRSGTRNLAIILLLTALALLVMGYHPGLEDDGYYLAAIKKNLNPALFPHDADFFRLQFQATIFDKLIAYSARLSHLPLTWCVLLWQIAAIYWTLWGAWQIARRCFAEAHAQWAAVTMVALLFTLPVSGTAINLADQYLHPRNLATAAITGAIVATLDKRRLLAGVLLAFAFATHAIMASFGISFCVFLGWEDRDTRISNAAFLLPLGWLFEPASDAWRQAASTRGFYYLSRWTWYDWLGVFGPLILLWMFRWIAQRDRSATLARVATRLLYFGIFQTVVGLVIMLPPGLERLRPFEPMRYLQLVYLLFFLIAGGLIGQYILGRHVYRWLLLFVPLGFGMFYAQRQLYAASAHLEVPGAASRNDWVDAFAWVRHNTPPDSLFALDSRYMELPGEDFHSFRALAERSALADFVKDGGMAARVPELAPRWLKEVHAADGWRNFQAADFRKLKQTFGVNWVVLARPGPAGLECPYQNRSVLVCRVE